MQAKGDTSYRPSQKQKAIKHNASPYYLKFKKATKPKVFIYHVRIKNVNNTYLKHHKIIR